MNKQQIEQQIDRFINNEMSLFEQEEFRRMLETDSHLKEQVKLRMILIEGELIRAEQKARLAIEASKHNIHPHSWVAVACILCIFAGIGLYVGSLHRYSPEEIYQEGTFRNDYSIDMGGVSARYVRVTAEGAGVCPDEHVRPGQEARVYFDEVIIE